MAHDSLSPEMEAATPSHRNNFDAVRLFAALLVIFGHQLQLKQYSVPLPLGVPISKTGVDLFFCLSGYLITDSWERMPAFGVFLRKRCLRIFPALIAVVVLTTFVLGPIVTTLPASAYIRHPATWRYLLNIPLRLEESLPGVFGQGTSAVNGSLWSLGPEFACYLTVPIFALLPRRPRMLALLAATALSANYGMAMIDGHIDISIYGADVKFVLVEVCFFFSGSFYRVLDAGRGTIYRADIAILLCFIRGVIGGHPGMMMDWFTMAYLLICFGRMCLPVLCRAARFGDLSYGMYLYAFPVQQIVIRANLPHALPLVVLITAALAFLSWHLVEKPALRLKPAR